MKTSSLIVAAMCLTMAKGAQLTYTGTVTATGLLTSPISVLQFNPALGTLLSVDISINSQSQANVSADSESATAGFMVATMSGTTRMDFPNSGFRAQVNFTGDLDSNYSIGADSDGVADFTGSDFYDFGLIQGSGSDTKSKTTGLSPYIGTGSIAGSIRQGATWTVSGSGAAQTATSNVLSVSDWTVTYNYTPTPVPEASSALLGLAGAVALVARRKRVNA